MSDTNAYLCRKIDLHLTACARLLQACMEDALTEQECDAEMELHADAVSALIAKLEGKGTSSK